MDRAQRGEGFSSATVGCWIQLALRAPDLIVKFSVIFYRVYIHTTSYLCIRLLMDT